MSTERTGRLSLTEAEAAVFTALAEGPCDTGPNTRTIERRNLTTRALEIIHQVDLRTCRRLANAGYVDITGGVATLTDAGRRHLQEDHHG